MNKQEMYLAVYGNRSELHNGDSKSVFWEGRQTDEAILRSQRISKAFQEGFYPNMMNQLQAVLDSGALSDEQGNLIKELVNGVTSEVGRALVGLSCLQLAIKTIEPAQSIRLHKGGKRNKGFSWCEGISMRTLDSDHNAPFLRKYGLLKLNKDGIMMTRSLAENYPYSRLYKAEMRGPVKPWLEIMESVEAGELPPKPALCLLLSLLKNRSDAFSVKADRTIALANAFDAGFAAVECCLVGFFTHTMYSARAFEIVIHSFMQAYSEMRFTDGVLVPLSQMRSANKKHGNVGDIEVKQGCMIVESWDAKYGKPYLRDELEELADKLEYHPNVEVAGFIVNSDVDRSKEILDRAAEISTMYGCEVMLLSFHEWISLKTQDLTATQVSDLAHHWILAVAESLGQKRPLIAPIDEPCDAWLDTLFSMLPPFLAAPDTLTEEQ